MSCYACNDTYKIIGWGKHHDKPCPCGVCAMCEDHVTELYDALPMTEDDGKRYCKGCWTVALEWCDECGAERRHCECKECEYHGQYYKRCKLCDEDARDAYEFDNWRNHNA